MKKVSCIIPAFNEEKQITAVLDAVIQASRKIPMEIIVVDDGSRDRTPQLLKNYPDIRVITNKQNKGKSYAIARGLETASGEYIFLLDADLIGLTPHNIYALFLPIQNGTTLMTMSIMKNAFILMRKMNLDYLSGIRIFHRDLIKDHINEIKKLPNFALEVFLNNLTIKNACPITSVYWNNVSNHYKYRKRGFFTGLRAESKMFSDIRKTVPARGLIGHNIALRKLLVKTDA